MESCAQIVDKRYGSNASRSSHTSSLPVRRLHSWCLADVYDHHEPTRGRASVRAEGLTPTCGQPSTPAPNGLGCTQRSC
jgi:hypothetical protein